MPYADCGTDIAFGGSWEAQRGGVRRSYKGGLDVPGRREPRNRRQVCGPLGAVNSKVAANFGDSWEAHGVVPHADQNEASPALKGLRTAKLSPRSWAPGRSGGVVPHADQNETSPSLGGCAQQDCRDFRGLLAGPAE